MAKSTAPPLVVSPLPLAGEGQGRGRPTSLKLAKQLRSHQTEAEQRLWYHLRAHRFMGLKFKRQKTVGVYVLDFVCLEHQLVIEVDGGQHGEQVTHDQKRTQWLAARGMTVLRFWNHEVLQETEAVLEKIRLWIEARRPSPGATRHPLPQAGEGKDDEAVKC